MPEGTGDFESKMAEMAAAQGGAEAAVETPVEKGPERGPDGKFVPKAEAEPEEKKPDQSANWKKVREELKELKSSLNQKDDYVKRLQEREDKLLELLAKGKTAEPADEDVWADLPKDDPDLALLKRKVDPALRKVLSKAEQKVAVLEKKLADLEASRETEAVGAREAREYQSALGEFAEEHGLDNAAVTAVNSLIRDGAVGGKTYEQAFSNALVFLKGKGFINEGGKEPAKKQEERASVGGIMPGQAGTPTFSDDYKALRNKVREARATGDYRGEEESFGAFFRKIQEEQGR